MHHTSTSTSPKYLMDDVESRKLEHEANLYALIWTVDGLEKAYASGITSAADYERICVELINQFASYDSILKESGRSLLQFIKDNDMYCPLAQERLTCQIPSTRLTLKTFSSQPKSRTAELATFFQLSGDIISLLDSLRLGETAVDSLLPELEKVMMSLYEVQDLPWDLNGLKQVTEWKLKLLKMNAYDELNANDCRQFTLDVDTIYESVRRWLEKQK